MIFTVLFVWYTMSLTFKHETVLTYNKNNHLSCYKQCILILKKNHVSGHANKTQEFKSEQEPLVPVFRQIM